MSRYEAGNNTATGDFSQRSRQCFGRYFANGSLKSAKKKAARARCLFFMASIVVKNNR